jgi:serpin B
MKKNALENKIKVSGDQYFSQRTSHLTFTRTLTKSKPWWSKALIWGTPSAALVTSVTVLVAILIGATQPNGSIPQTFQTIQALNQVSYPSLDQRDQAEDFLEGQPTYDAYRESINAFFQLTASSLFDGQDNVTYSPLSAYAALSLLLEAADGETYDTLASLLGIESIQQLRQDSSQAFIDTYLEQSQTVVGNEELIARSQMSNGVFVREDISVQPDYLSRLAGDYFAEVFHTQFDQSGLQDLALWLNQKTFGFLQINPNDLSINQDTAMVLFNTLYLKANWLNPFQRISGSDAFTNTTNGEVIDDVTYMQKTTPSSLYLDHSDFTLGADMLYGDHRVIYVLPKGDLSPVELLDSPYFPIIESSFQQTDTNERIQLTIPKMSTKGKLDLKENLLTVAPSIANLFDPLQANLSKALDGGFLQSFQQHIRVDFLEEGMEAAAITEADVGVTSAPITPRVQLNLNRSFLYFVVNRQGLLLFSGVVNQPSFIS